ncbi:GDP-L-fucose synthase family protein [Neorhodopirellula pilleata]|uniref:GDP-L-fucose synthase n=1 Tax=Neorhodopirellula pilleata TaxID=2714738 RepID=A0A5C6ARU0_9BACT|nr:GDP-L-fucose synthase [Neorhodopirellula pilleata]TWU01806.1 GDP-L-fucose synthase [Neorhodopirellula pilleata]
MSSSLPFQRIFVAGHRGMVGRAVLRQLEPVFQGEVLTRTRSQLDLCDQRAVADFFADARPDCVVFAAAKVGGIHANATYPAEFAYENMMMAANAIHAAYQNQTERFLFLGSTCIYPRACPQPIQESSLLTGPLESTNEAYALAKIAGLKLCQHYRNQYGVLFHSAMPTNLYGPGDNYHHDNSHVIPGLIRRFHEAHRAGAKTVSVWGSGKPRREFLHVDDLAAAIVHLIGLQNPPDWVNVGTGVDLPVADLAALIAETVGFEGEIVQDESKPDGTPVKRTDTTVINNTGWFSQINLRDGLQSAYQDFVQSIESERLRSV